jgi:hypothetical protein
MFAPAVSSLTGATLDLRVALGDFNGDGKMDVATANYGNGSVSVLQGNGAGNFVPFSGSPIAGLGQPYDVKVADFNGDGKLDLVVSDYGGGGATAIRILLGNGNGTFQAPVSVNTGGSGPLAVAVGDFNNDGKPDVAVDNYASSTVNILLNNGGPTILTPGTAVSSGGSSPYYMSVGDFNGDGKLDVVSCNFGSSTVGILFGNGLGGLGPAAAYGLGASNGLSVGVGDFNGDGKPDLAVAAYGSGGYSILLNSGTGTFPTATFTSLGLSNTYDVAVADFNGDSNLDLAFVSYNGNSGGNLLNVLLGNGTGSFAQIFASPLAAGQGLISVAAGDLDGDSDMDLVTGEYNAGHVWALLNRTGTRMSLTSSPNPAQSGQAITFTATVTPTTPGTPPVRGFVSFFDGGTLLANVPVSNGVATFTTSSLGIGSHTITARYTDTTLFFSSTKQTVIETVTSPPQQSNQAPILVFGADFGNLPELKVFDANTLALKYDSLAYSSSFRGGVRVACADLDGDGYADIITAPGPGGGPLVKVFSGADLSLMFAFNAYDPGFNSGLFVAAGDVNGDGIPDIITGPDAGGGPLVKVFSGKDGSLLVAFNAYATNFLGGVHVATGKLTGTSRASIITGPGIGGGPLVAVFDGNGVLQVAFNAYAAAFQNGVWVSAADVNGDGIDEIITGPGVGGGPLVAVFTSAGAVQYTFTAGPATLPSGVRVAGVLDLNGNGNQEIMTGSQVGITVQQDTVGGAGGVSTQIYDGLTLAMIDSFFAFNPFVGSYFLAGSR